MSPARAVLGRLRSGLLTLLLVTAIVFALLHATPGGTTPGGDAGDERLATLTPGQLAELRAIYHLDEPLHRQYVLWLGDVVRGDLGRSFHDARPVAEKIRERLPVTLMLNVVALSAMVVVAVPLGAVSAWRRGTAWDGGVALASYALYAVPPFWAALLLQLAFAVELRWLPLYGLGGPKHLVLPVVCLSYGGIAYLTRFVRSSLIDGSFGDAARAARARGVSATRLVAAHGLRLASVPLLTLAGFLVPGLLGGSVIVESVFALPGLGRLFADAVLGRDLPVVLGLTLLSGSATLLGIVLADLTYAAADPRVARRPHAHR